MAQKIKLLVANRSEIACRIFQAGRELGLTCVGLVAPGDETGRHVTFADEMLEVPSYLDAATIVQKASRIGVQLVHPGYGFLSERPKFSKAVEQAGMIFVGPKAESMEALGEKIAAKRLAEAVGVPTLPWAVVEKGQDIKAAAKKVGYPLLLKASAGGGGKGMRVVQKPEELQEAADSASREAQAAFGDGALFLERKVDHARHIEVQVFGDGQGKAMHFFERDCSLQRRHQKIWEECLAPGLSDRDRQGLCDAAVQLAMKTKYRSAGTVEFLYEGSGQYYFLEMNTRLQVEHPITEAVMGVDLVLAQLEHALTQTMPVIATPRGHAIEVRLCAEDPSIGFAPSPGTCVDLVWPTGAGIRVESGIELGQAIGGLFDSMLAKLIVWAPNRTLAIRRLKGALEQTVLAGLATNQSYLHALCDARDVLSWKVHTKYLEETFAEPFAKRHAELKTLAKPYAVGHTTAVHDVDGGRSPWIL